MFSENNSNIKSYDKTASKTNNVERFQDSVNFPSLNDFTEDSGWCLLLNRVKFSNCYSPFATESLFTLCRGRKLFSDTVWLVKDALFRGMAIFFFIILHGFWLFSKFILCTMLTKPDLLRLASI